MNMKTIFAALITVAIAASAPGSSTFPDPAKDSHPTGTVPAQTAVLAGGCFWGVEAVFEQMNGVSDVVSGYAGGSQMTAHYSVVSSGITSHAESVKITFDPAKVSYGRLLKVFFAVAHDPTQLNRQGPDEGRQYRSSIFYANDEQKSIAEAYITQLEKAHIFNRPIVTTVVPLEGFYAAEDYHQNFLAQHPDYPYIVVNDLPKLRALKAEFPELVKSKK
ncbi:MAG TPA: peptide-methionine (S)-S-oxide reductase MsrA [Vicinamibacterales bacterium]|nr:peptide-methionine (S)-S-oxide reductase MsrA [Vicinamibacterales bacterium]